MALMSLGGASHNITAKSHKPHSPAAPGNLIELSFDELEADPLGMLRRVYERFGWGDTRFAALRPALEAYCATLGDFKKNMHTRWVGCKGWKALEL